LAGALRIQDWRRGRKAEGKECRPRSKNAEHRCFGGTVKMGSREKILTEWDGCHRIVTWKSCVVGMWAVTSPHRRGLVAGEEAQWGRDSCRVVLVRVDVACYTNPGRASPWRKVGPCGSVPRSAIASAMMVIWQALCYRPSSPALHSLISRTHSDLRT
jgi:hypothetical protein